MGHVTNPESQCSQIREPSLATFKLDNIIQYIKNNNISLAENELAAIQMQLANNKRIITLEKLLNDFILMYEQLNALPGLTHEQKNELRNLILTRKGYKDTNNNKPPNIAEMKLIISNEKKLLPYHQAIQWWSINLAALKKLRLWEDINTVIARQIENGAEEKLVTNKIHQLADIKNNWNKHQYFAGLSSNDLIDFYKNNICVLEQLLEEEMTNQAGLPEILIEYTKSIIINVREIKKQAVYSMLFRLISCEYFNDILCDDVLSYTFDEINKISDIGSHSKGKKPLLRTGLNTKNIIDFIHEIETYCQKNSNEHIIQDHLNMLSFKKNPALYSTIKINDKKIISASLDPIILFFMNKFQELLDQARTEKNSVKMIFGNANQTNLISKLNVLISLTIQQFQIITNKNWNDSLDDVSKIILKFKQNLNELTSQFVEKAAAEMEGQLINLINDILRKDQLSSEKAISLADNVIKLNEFNIKFNRQTYLAACDIILILSDRLNKFLDQHPILTNQQIEKIIKLFKFFIPNINEKQLQQTKNQLITLSKLDNQNDINQAQRLHRVTYILEKNLAAHETLDEIINRHLYIAKIYHEPWAENNAESTPIERYIKNVVLKIIETSPDITLENFDAVNLSLKTSLFTQPMQKQLQNAVLAKINTKFLVQHYLISADENNIDIDKLTTLIYKTEKFFTNENNKQTFLNTIQSSVQHIMKTMILTAIENNQPILLANLHEANNILNTDLFSNLIQDNDIIIILRNYVENYDGTTTYISSLLSELVSKRNSESTKQFLIDYAKKRLDYISASRKANADDYSFFYHANVAPVLTNFLGEYTKKISGSIQTNHSWQKDTASLIELFGSDDQVIAYREKFLYLLLQTKNRSDQDQHINNLLLLTNTNRLFNHLFLPEKYKTRSGETLNEIINKFINEQNWSPALEKLFSMTANQTQLQNWHFKLLDNYIDNRTDISSSWLSLQFEKASLYSNPKKDFYFDFFGSANIKKLVAKIDEMMHELDILILKLRDINTEFNFSHAINLIDCIKSFADFYTAFNPHLINLFENLQHFKNTLVFQNYLRTTFLPLSNKLYPAKENNQTCQQLLQMIAQVENSTLFSSNNILDYIVFWKTNIFPKINALVSHDQTNDISLLFSIYDLLSELASQKLKTLVLSSQQSEIKDHPFWLSLVNRLNQESSFDTLQDIISKNSSAIPPSENFNIVFSFAKNLNQLKHFIHQKTKYLLLRKANIEIKNQKTLHLASLFQSTNISNHQLLKLYSICKTQLLNQSKTTDIKLLQSYFLIRMISCIAAEILFRARNNPELLTSFTKELAFISDFYHFLKSQNKAQPVSIWSAGSETEKLIEPLLAILNKTRVLQSIHAIEKYTQQKIGKNKFETYKKICNDRNFSDNSEQNQINQLLEIKDERDARKIINTMIIYQHLLLVWHDKEKIQTLAPIINHIKNQDSVITRIFSSRGYSKLIDDINLLIKPTFLSEVKQEPILSQKKRI